MANLLDRIPVPVTQMYCGVATLGAGGTATIAFKDITANSIVLLSMAATDNTGTPEYAITAGTGFVISSSQAGDTGNVSWVVIVIP